MRAWPAAPRPAATASRMDWNLRLACACTISTSTGSARQMSSSQVMECSNALDNRSECAGSASTVMNPRYGCGPGRLSRVDPDEMEHGVLVDDGGLLKVLDALAVL